MTKTWHRLLMTTFLLCLTCAATVSWGNERCAVSASIANIRQGPGTSYDILWRVEKYYPVIVKERKGDWVKFEDFEKDQGWIHESLLNSTQTVVVKENNCNVREGPGTNYPVLFKAQKGVPFKALETKDNWVRIKHADGDTGWIYKPLVW